MKFLNHTIWKPVLVVAGTVSLGLGVLGIFLPLLPTVPFLLLAASCYVRSSNKLYRYLITHPYAGKIILDFQKNKIIPHKAKLYSITLLWVSISISISIVGNWWIRLLLLVVAVGVTIHIMSFKSSL